MMNIQNLLLKVTGGDETAFKKLTKLYYDPLLKFVLTITDCKMLSEEIVQDIYMKVWMERISLQNIRCFDAYIYIIARNHALNCIKQIDRKKRNEKQWIQYQHLHQSDDTDVSGIYAMLDKAIDLLPPQQKRVFNFSRAKKMKHLQIANEMNISLETVKKHMVLALRFVKNYVRSHAAVTISFMLLQDASENFSFFITSFF